MIDNLGATTLLAIYSHVQDIQWIEFFAGLGNLSTMMKASGYTTMRFDVLDHCQEPHRKSNYMDLTHQSGFGFLVTIP